MDHLVRLLRDDLRAFKREPFHSNTTLGGKTFYLDSFAHVSLSYDSPLKGDHEAQAFASAVSRAIWHKPVVGSSWRLGTAELKRGTSIVSELEREAVLKRYEQVISGDFYKSYL